jgi:hypothetical protein
MFEKDGEGGRGKEGGSLGFYYEYGMNCCQRTIVARHISAPDLPPPPAAAASPPPTGTVW